MIVYDASRRPLTLGPELDRGGEAVIRAVGGRSGTVAKVYAEPRPGYRDKLEHMLRHPPSDPSRRAGHASIAWPTELAFDARGRLCGYLMPFVRNAVSMLEVLNPRRRAQTLPGFNRLYLHRVARNLAAALGALHARDYVVGDLNETNVLVTPSAMVTVIDTDSFQVRATGDARIVVYPCPVGRVEYTPPELQGRALRNIIREPEHDNFGLGVLVFQLLVEGSHPFRGHWRGTDDPPSLQDKIARGWFPHAPDARASIGPPPGAPPLDRLYPDLVTLVQRCFVDGHADPRQRPTAEAWAGALSAAERALRVCGAGHAFSEHLHRCPECGRKASGAPATRRAPAERTPGADAAGALAAAGRASVRGAGRLGAKALRGAGTGLGRLAAAARQSSAVASPVGSGWPPATERAREALARSSVLALFGALSAAAAGLALVALTSATIGAAGGGPMRPGAWSLVVGGIALAIVGAAHDVGRTTAGRGTLGMARGAAERAWPRVVGWVAGWLAVGLVAAAVTGGPTLDAILGPASGPGWFGARDMSLAWTVAWSVFGAIGGAAGGTAPRGPVGRLAGGAIFGAVGGLAFRTAIAVLDAVG